MKKIIAIFLITLITWSCGSQREESTPEQATDNESEQAMGNYEPTNESISTHPLPTWYDDSKLGIFVCWGLYSVPGWAEGTEIPLEEIFAKNQGDIWFKENPYAEWYLNSLKVDGSTTREYHNQKYGEDFSYDDFIPIFNEESRKWNPDEMAELIKGTGAGYVVLVSKFHDGMILWPTDHPNPFKPNYVAERDIVGELTNAVKERGMKMGLYYSSGLDWTYNEKTINSFPDLFQAIPQQEEYIDYFDNHWRELIDKYDPQILWADIGSPNEYNAVKLIADFYNQNPEGVVNNRHKLSLPGPTGSQGVVIHHDFTTPEYQVLDSISEEKWETVRGIGLSFGYNRNEDENEYLSVDELVDMFIDIVSKNGNLLLNIGPKGDGSIPEQQREVLEGFSEWIKVNGEGIFGSRPWITASAETSEGGRVRFTKKSDEVYMFLLDEPKNEEIIIANFPVDKISEIYSLSKKGAIPFSLEDGSLKINIKGVPQSNAHTFKVTL